MGVVTSLVTMSTPPAGEYGTTTVTARSGKPAAAVAPLASISPAASAVAPRLSTCRRLGKAQAGVFAPVKKESGLPGS